MKKTIRKINRFLFKEKKKHHIIFSFVSILLIVVFTANLFFANNQTALGATYTFSQTSWTGGITANNAVHPTNQTSWTQFSASSTGMTTANSGADLQLLATAGSTAQTGDTDFNLGSSASTTVYNGSIKLSGTNPPASGGSNLGTQVTISTGSSASDEAFYPFIIQTSSGKYRIYYTYANSYSQLAYKETTDTNLPASSGSNLGSQVLIGTGSSSSDAAYTPYITQLSDGKYRIYYSYYSGSYYQLAYKETTDTNLPASSGSNLGSRVLIGTGSSSSDAAHSPFVIRLSDGKYRIYYTYLNGTYQQLAYKETTDTNLPASSGSNLGSRVLIGTGSSASDRAYFPHIIQLSDGKYRIYYAYSDGNYYQLAYKETTDTNLPASSGSNLGSMVLIGTGSSASDEAFSPFIVSLANGKYRIYYSYANGTHYQLAYKETTDGGFDTSGIFTSSVVDTIASSTFTTLAYTATTPTNTSLTVDIRAGNTSTPDGAWTSWQTGIANGGSLSALNGNRYVQYRANFTQNTGNLPASSGSNLGSQATIATGSGTLDYALSPNVIQLSDGKYRIYYAYFHDGTSGGQLAYKETTDTNLPNSSGSNLGAQVLIGTGSGASDQADSPYIIQLSDGKYRIYYAYFNGTYSQLAYKETTDTNPPASSGSNLGARVTVGTGSGGSDQAYYPFIIQLSSGKYRIYYTYNSGTYYQIAYKETTDTNPPASGGSNLGARATVGVGSSASDWATSPFIIQLSDGKYRIYYTYYDGSTYWRLAYKETTDTNPPASSGSNLGSQTLVNTGSGASDQAFSLFIIRSASGSYRMYYSYYNGTYWQLAYKETSDTTTPSLDDITVNYTQYATSTDLTSSPYNSSDSANILSKIQWTESLTTGTDIKFQLRTAPNSAGSPGTWTSWLGPDGTSATYFTDSTGGETMPSAFTSGGDDQWVQYKAFMTSTGANTPTLSDTTLTYVVNAAPSIQTVTASQGSDGNVAISYEVKDTDTSSGTANPGYITPSFEYWNGSSWANITSGLATLATTTKAVNQSSFTSYNTTWTASTTIGSQYYSAAKIRVTANDNEAANNTANDQSAEFVIDTTTPVSTSILVKATTTPAILSLSASDNSSLQMKVSLNSDLSGSSWETYSASKTISLATDPDTVYARFKDAYGNESATISASSQTTPSNTMIQDTSNVNASPDELRFFLAWDVTADPALGFGSYHVYRSTDGSSWSLLSSVGTRTTNYYMDSTPSASTTYYYKVAVVDASGNASYMSATSTGTANGIQDGSEGGGGTSNTAPTISSVSSSNTTTQSSVVSWTTDALSNSVVGYCASPCSDYTTSQSTVSSYLTAHSVALTGLSPNTTYNYKVFSTDSSSNTASSSGYTLTTNSGPSISAVAVTNVNNVSADITWNTNIAASGYVIYSTTTPPSGGEGGWATRNTSRTVSLTSLTGGTKYYFYVKSQDIDNNWAYDYNISSGTTTYYSFTTPLDVSAPIISSVASTTERTTASITWQTDEEANSRVIYGTTTAYGATTTLDTTLTAIHSVSLSSLVPGTTYHYKAISSDGSGNQATSSDYTLLTETLSLTGITATTPTVTTATIAWTTSDNATSQVEYSTFSDLASSTSYPTSPSDSVTSHSVSLSSLSQGTTYYYRVNSAASGLGTTTSQIYQFTTGDTTAPTVSSVSAGSIKDTSAVITWTTDEPANTQVQYGSSSGSYTTSTTLNSTLTRNHSATLTGLSFQSTYYYRVLSSDGNSNATTSSESFFTTLEEQINKSQQTITTTTVISGGGGGGGSTGVPLSEVNNLKLELGAIKKERDDYKKENDDLRGKIIGANLTGESLSPTEVIGLVIDKFKEITDNLTESALTIQDNVASQAQAEKLEKDIIPAVTSLRQLAKLVPPPKLKTEPKLEIGPTEAIVSWLTDKLATSVVYFSESKDYSEKTPDTYTNSAEDSKNYVEDHKITLKGLSPLTDYHYRLMSESEAGAKAYSSDFTFTTKPETPVISSARAEKNSDTSILVTWRTNIPTNSAVIYTPIIAGKPDAKKSKSEGSPEFDKDHSITVSRLEPSTIYSLEISSSDHFGNVALKKLDSMSIAKDATPPVISQVRNEASILSGSANKVQSIFYWKTDEPSTTNVIFEKGQAVPGAEDTFSEKSAPNEELTMNHIAVVTSWEPGQLYRFKVVSVDAFGNEAKSKTFTVVAPRQKATVVDLIINNFSDTFDWTKKMGF